MQREAWAEVPGDAESYQKVLLAYSKLHTYIILEMITIGYTNVAFSEQWNQIIQELARTIGISLDALDK